VERRPRRVENHRKGDLAAETGSCPDGDVRLLPLRREHGQGLGRGLSILVFVLGARGLWGSEPDSVGDDGRDGGKRADGERRRGSVEEDVVLHLSFTFSSSLSLVELEKTSPPWTSTGAAVMDLWTQRGRPCGVQSAEGDCVSRPIMTASLPPSLSQIWVPGPSRFITPPAAIPGCAVGRPDSPVTHTEIHITAKAPWAASILTQIAIVLKHADASHGRLCQASSGDSRRINATVASSVSDHRQALSTSGWRTLLPCQAAGAFRCVRGGHTALRPHIFH